MFVVVVDFHIHPGRVDDFMTLMLANASASLELEAGCLQFDVCISKNDRNHIFLYEVYQTDQDFGQHLQAAHFLAFNLAVGELVSSKKVQTFERCE
jgi:autoinducer 2-degrading protein